MPSGIFGLLLRRHRRDSRPHNTEMQNDKPNKKLWPRLALLGASLSILTILILTAGDLMGLGPNLGFPFGYYGRFNRVLARIEASPDVEVLQTTLHRDLELEDFNVTVRTQDGREVSLTFAGAHERPFDELLEELEKVGI